jgi:hypothetical protein
MTKDIKISSPSLKLSQETIKNLKNNGYHYIHYFQDITRERFIRQHKDINKEMIDEIELAMSKVKMSWRPAKVFNRNKMIREIIEVFNYRDGDYYVGSLATEHVRHLLNYPNNIDTALETARDKTVQNIHDYLESYIDHMIDAPVKICEVCGSIVRKDHLMKGLKLFTKRLKEIILDNLKIDTSDTFRIDFAPNYIKTLVNQVGIDKAKKRLLEEGTLSLEVQINNIILEDLLDKKE